MKALLALLRRCAADSLALWRLAPVIPLLAAAGELAQHWAEVRLGMFASRNAFRMMAMAPARWEFGYWKVAALGAAALAAAWFWARREEGRHWASQRGVIWSRFTLGIALVAATTAASRLWDGRISAGYAMLAGLAVSLATLPLNTLIAGALLGDRAMTLGRAFRSGWWIAARMLLLLLAGFVPLQLLHLANHELAYGQAAGLLWTILAWDALVLGMMAAWMGTAVYLGYRAPPLAKR